MRRQFSIVAVAAALLMGVTSCNKDNGGAESAGEGTLKISFGFATVDPTRAANSAAVPTTAWSNIGAGNLQLVLVQSEKAVVVRSVTVPAAGSATTPAEIFDRIPAGSYDIYLIANNNRVGNPFGSASAKIGTTTTIQAGTNFSTALFEMITSANVLGTPPVSGAYDEASELFIGYATGTITADATTTTTVQLKRAVSLLRVRIDQTDVTSEANTILFTGAGAANTSVRLRRHASSLRLTNTDPYATANFGANKIDYAFVSTKAFNDAEPGSGYSGTMGIQSSDFTLWNDYVILPGGHATTGADKFNLLLSGHAPINYVGVNGVTSTGSGAGARVWWQAEIDDLIAANGILSLNVKVATKGYVDPNPPTDATYGKLEITASLVDWSPVKNVVVPM